MNPRTKNVLLLLGRGQAKLQNRICQAKVRPGQFFPTIPKPELFRASFEGTPLPNP